MLAFFCYFFDTGSFRQSSTGDGLFIEYSGGKKKNLVCPEELSIQECLDKQLNVQDAQTATR